jgi:hypothetical protein
MKKLALLFVLAFPMASQADYLDVIGIKMTGACSMAKYVQAVKDFNEQWGKSHGYRSEILAPIQSEDVKVFYWVGRTTSAETFGRGLDEWNQGLNDPNSLSAKLMARFAECTTIISRSSYATY